MMRLRSFCSIGATSPWLSGDASKECLRYICTLLALQWLGIFLHLTLVASGIRSFIPITGITITLFIHMFCALLLTIDVQRTQGKPWWWPRCLTFAISSSLVLDTFFLCLSRADVQHYFFYKFGNIDHLMIAAHECELAGGEDENPNEDVCLLGQSQMIHGLALFWSIYFVLFVVPSRYLVFPVILSMGIYVVMAILGSSSLHLTGQASFFLHSDLLWFVLSLCAMLVARDRLDRNKAKLFAQLESQSQETIKEKVLRCEAEFEHHRFKVIVEAEQPDPSMSSGTEIKMIASAAAPPAGGSCHIKKATPSCVSAPAFMSTELLANEFPDACCETGDCLPSDSLVWIDGFSAPRCLSTVLVGQKVLCYDSLSSSLKYASILDVGATGVTTEKEWVTIALDDGTELLMTADHPVQCYSSKDNSLACTSKRAGEVRVASDEILVMRTVAVPVRSIAAPQVAPVGHSWKISVLQPDRHMVFVANHRKGASNQVMAIGPSNLNLTPARKLSDNRSTISAPTPTMPQGGYSDPAARVGNGNGRFEDWDQKLKDQSFGFRTASVSDASEGKDKRRSEYRVASHLAKLDAVDASRVVKIKNIAALGFNSAIVLRDYLSQFGQVEEVLLCRSQEEMPQPSQGYRHRPSRSCFVVMGSAEEAAAVLRQGDTQVVANTTIVVQKFMRNVASYAKENGKGAEHMKGKELTAVEYWDRLQRAQITEPIPACGFWPPPIRLEL